MPWARAGVGAVATQAAGVAAYGARVLDELAAGNGPDDAIERVLARDGERETRQLGAVTAAGDSASFTGSACLAWAGGRTGRGYAVQGNILAGEDVVAEMEAAFLVTAGTLAHRLVAALEAGQAAGGDARGEQSAAVIVERAEAAAETRDGIDRVCDLRVDDHPEPIAELRRLLGIHEIWDALRRAAAHHRPGQYERGVAILRREHERSGDDATLLYDLACFEALAGSLDDARAHLARSLELEPSYESMAATDEDLAALR